MHITRLQIQGLRSLDDARLELDPGLNLLIGANGAGKTSVLEALHLLSHGRSFRSGARDALLQRGRDAYAIYAELHTAHGGSHRLGLGRRAGRWKVRIDGEEGRTLGDLVSQCAVVCFEPGSHALIAGPAEERRRFLDWGVFHVEHAFLSHWRRYQRAMRQRNALLRDTGGRNLEEASIAPWEQEMSRAGEEVAAGRARYVQKLHVHLEHSLGILLPELGPVHVEYRRGWNEHVSLGEMLVERRSRDMFRGHSGAGPHRADWSLVFEHAPQREHLSRGQEKLCALGCVLAQAACYAHDHGEWPVFCLDDLASELDLDHQARLVQLLLAAQAQILVTGTSSIVFPEGTDPCMFHVEQGRILRT